LATDINDQLKELKINNRGTKEKDLYVLHYNSQPSILIELGYINSSKDYKYINSDTYKNEVAQAVTNGLKNYFK
jgi:N-acetylmuramoyl-L-alanine amidase